MSRIDDIFNTQSATSYLADRTFEPTIGQTLFPERKTDEFELEYFTGASNLPVAASIHALDTEAEIASRGEAEKRIIDKALIKRKIPIMEKDIMNLAQPRSNAEVERIVKRLYNDLDTMAKSVYTRVEAMRMEALETGKLVVDENNVKLQLDYKMPNAHKENLGSTDTWDNEGSDPLEDIYRWTDKIVSDTGITPGRALTTRKVINTLRMHPAIRKGMLGVNSEKLITLAELNQFLSSMDLPILASYDAKYNVEEKNGKLTQKHFISENAFILMPNHTLGETVFGPTPEEVELITNSEFDIKKIGNITGSVDKEFDPVRRWTKASALVLPSFPLVEQVFSAKVL